MVELRTRKREMRGYGRNQPEQLGLKRIPCASQLTILETAVTSADPACNISTRRSSQPNQASCTPDFACPLLSSTSFSSLSPNSLIVVHNPTINAENIVKSSLSISPCDEYELTPSEAYTEYSINRVHHTPSTEYTKYSINPRLGLFTSFS